MKKTHLICLGICLATLSGMAQVPASKEQSKTNVSENHKAIRPPDGTPYVFSTQEELNAKKQDKLSATHDLIEQNKANPERVKELRMNLWRIENAVVAPANK